MDKETISKIEKHLWEAIDAVTLIENKTTIHPADKQLFRAQMEIIKDAIRGVAILTGC